MGTEGLADGIPVEEPGETADNPMHLHRGGTSRRKRKVGDDYRRRDGDSDDLRGGDRVEEVMEVWRSIDGAAGYEVSTCGRVRNTKTGRVLATEWRDNKRGRRDARVKLHDRHHVISRLVAMTFLGDGAGDGMTVNHIDGDLRNNHVTNLEWMSRRHNVRNEISNGSCCRIKGRIELTECGTNQSVIFDRVKDAADFSGCSNGSIRRAYYNRGSIRANDGRVWTVSEGK